MSKLANLKRYIEHIRGRTPQVGMFSTLDEAIRGAPMPQAPAEQWGTYLQPGRTIQRGEVNFPLKKSELEAVRLHELLSQIEAPISREELAGRVESQRPEFGIRLGSEGRGHTRYELESSLPEDFSEDELMYLMDEAGVDPESGVGFETTDPRYGKYAHMVDPKKYEENMTRMGDLNYGQGHFPDDTLSWSRTTSHETPTGKLRLIEEIQSDLHQQGRERGYRTPEDQGELDRLSELRRSGELTDLGDIALAREMIGDLLEIPPEAPFKDPKEYAELEIKKQLLNAVNEGEDYLALVNPEDQLERYGTTAEREKGMQHMYGKIYPSVLKKLAKQYGAEIEEVPLDIGQPKLKLTAGFLTELGMETPDQFYDTMSSMTRADPDDIELSLDTLDSTLSYLSREGFEDEVEDIRGNLDSFESEYGLGSSEDVARRLHDPDSELSVKLDIVLNEITELLEEHAYDSGNLETNQKTFKALKLTPEVKKRIQDAGVSLFTPAAGASLLLGQDEENQYAEGGAAKSGVNRLKLIEEQKMNMADGGSIDLKLLKKAMATGLPWATRLANPMNQLAEMVTGDPVPTDREKRLAELMGSGLLSQWMTLNEDTGEPEWGTYPGVIDETLAIPSLGELVGLPVPEWSEAAAERADRLTSGIKRGMDVEDPSGALEQFADALGVMSAQLPVPGSLIKRTGRDLPRWAKVLTSPVRAGIEWLSPIVEPHPAAYGAGATFGAVMGLLGEDDRDLLQKAMEGDEEAMIRLNQLLQSATGEPEMAKGGKIKEALEALKVKSAPGKMELRQSLFESGVPENQQLSVPQTQGQLEQILQSVTDKPMSRRELFENTRDMAIGTSRLGKLMEKVLPDEVLETTVKPAIEQVVKNPEIDYTHSALDRLSYASNLVDQMAEGKLKPKKGLNKIYDLIVGIDPDWSFQLSDDFDDILDEIKEYGVLDAFANFGEETLPVIYDTYLRRLPNSEIIKRFKNPTSQVEWEWRDRLSEEEDPLEVLSQFLGREFKPEELTFDVREVPNFQPWPKEPPEYQGEVPKDYQRLAKKLSSELGGWVGPLKVEEVEQLFKDRLGVGEIPPEFKDFLRIRWLREQGDKTTPWSPNAHLRYKEIEDILRSNDQKGMAKGGKIKKALEMLKIQSTPGKMEIRQRLLEDPIVPENQQLSTSQTQNQLEQILQSVTDKPVSRRELFENTRDMAIGTSRLGKLMEKVLPDEVVETAVKPAAKALSPLEELKLLEDGSSIIRSGSYSQLPLVTKILEHFEPGIVPIFREAVEENPEFQSIIKSSGELEDEQLDYLESIQEDLMEKLSDHYQDLISQLPLDQKISQLTKSSPLSQRLVDDLIDDPNVSIPHLGLKDMNEWSQLHQALTEGDETP